MLPTNRIYYEDTYKNKFETKIIRSERDLKGTYLIFDQTIFHPQGGGQPADQGFIVIQDQKYPILELEEDRTTGIIKHYIASSLEHTDLVSRTVQQVIDLELRIKHAKLHTAGHLLSNIVEMLNPYFEAYKGNHYPNDQAWVVFKRLNNSQNEEKESEITQEYLVQKFLDFVQEEIPISIHIQGKSRIIQIGTFKAYPCGGTHLKHTGQLSMFSVRSIKIQKGELKIGYDAA